MGVYIKGMEMPTSCFYCPFREKVNPDDYVCMALNKEFEETFSLIVGKRHKDCPLVEVKTPHGRLIDERELINNVIVHSHQSTKTIGMALDNSPTVIEAEEE